VAAVAVHGIRVRVGDLTTAYPKMVSILPREFAQTPVFFGGHISGASGIYTDIAPGQHTITIRRSPVLDTTE
jgi:hypothetical protein